MPIYIVLIFIATFIPVALAGVLWAVYATLVPLAALGSLGYVLGIALALLLYHPASPHQVVTKRKLRRQWGSTPSARQYP